jgi:hypothetical protein
MKTFLRLAALLFLLLLLDARALAEPPEGGPTPPRLSLIEGEVSFWRPGADEWTAARLNTPLAAGDALYAGDQSNLEVQIGSRAFVRAADETELSLVNRDPDYLQFKVAQGQASFDIRALPSGTTIEVDTPNAAFTIDRAGYYRLDVDRDTTHFTTRRGGRATVVPAGGSVRSIAASEEALIEGSGGADVETYVAPDPDSWDRWNFARTDDLIDALSERYLPPDVYGGDELDRAGRWRVVPSYGTVWVPSAVSPGWAPYSAGHWIWDPFYGWTWIDDAPWGWAPFHYGRWVFINDFWAWAPGPAVRRTVYAPALVAFFNSHGGASVGVGVGTPALSWVALSWGEPVLPWWGPVGFVGVPWWGGWGGPRVVNNVVVNRGTVVNVSHINFHNTRVNNAVTGVHRDHFGHRPVRGEHIPQQTLAPLTPVVGRLPVRPLPASLTPGPASRMKPPEDVLTRPVVSLRPSRETRLPWRSQMRRIEPAVGKPAAAPDRRFVPPPAQAQGLPRPAPFGTRGGLERPAPPPAPRFEETRRVMPPASPPERGNAAPAKREMPAYAREARDEMERRRAASQATHPQPVRPHAPATRPPEREQPAPHQTVPAIPPAYERGGRWDRRHEEERRLPGEPANRTAGKHGGPKAQPFGEPEREGRHPGGFSNRDKP